MLSWTLRASSGRVRSKPRTWRSAAVEEPFCRQYFFERLTSSLPRLMQRPAPTWKSFEHPKLAGVYIAVSVVLRAA
jgi:hypothetical protein